MVRWLAIVGAAVMVAVWPAGGAAHSGTAGLVGTRGADAPSRQEAVAVAAPHSAAVAQATDQVTQARAAVDQIWQRLGALYLTAYEDDTKVLPAAAQDRLTVTRAQRYADVAAQVLTSRLADAQVDLDAAEQQQRQALTDYFTALAAAAERAERDAREQAMVTSAVVVSAPPTGSCAGVVACFLACTRAHESDTAGGYQAVSPDGIYRGAYQFDQPTWNSVADSIGRGDLIGTDSAAASPADQDTLAAALYEMRGNQPWGGRC